MDNGAPRHVDAVIVGNGPSALILSYILHGHIPYYDQSSPHPDAILHEKLLASSGDLLDVDIDSLTEHFAASRLSYSTQALPVNVLLDTLIRPLGETDDAENKTCVRWEYEPSRAVSHVVIGQTTRAGGQWVDDPVHASWDIGTLSYAGMISLPGYGFSEHYKSRNGRPMPTYLRPSRHAVADYLAAYPDRVGISGAVHNGQHISGVARHSSGFHIASHNILCKNLVLASGIFSDLIQPPALLQPLYNLQNNQLCISPDPLLVIGSGFSAADVIISTPPSQKIIHMYKWAPNTSPSPLKACHQQAYQEYAGVYRRMKLAAVSPSRANSEKHSRPRHPPSAFDLSRDWEEKYEGVPNAEIIDIQLTEDDAAVLTFQPKNATSFQRQVSGLAYVVGRRGSLAYLSPSLLKEVLPAGTSDSGGMRTIVSGQTLREKANDDLEVAPHVFVIGSLTGDSLIRFAYGGCAYAAGRIIHRPNMNLVHECAIENEHRRTGSDLTNGVAVRIGLREGNRSSRNSSRFQTPTSSPRIPAMNGLDGHEASPVSLAGEKGTPLDRRQE